MGNEPKKRCSCRVFPGSNAAAPYNPSIEDMTHGDKRAHFSRNIHRVHANMYTVLVRKFHSLASYDQCIHESIHAVQLMRWEDRRNHRRASFLPVEYHE